MAEFRRGLIAFAVVALLLVLGSSAYAQNCVANTATPHGAGLAHHRCLAAAIAELQR